MKNNTYSRLLMAPLLMLLAVACSPNQFNQTSEYDDVYFTSSDRSALTASKTKTQQALLNQQQKQVTVDNYSTQNVDAQLLSKYNNGQPQQVTYFEDGPIVQSVQDLNYDNFVADYENEQLAYYELPLDWNQDWDRSSFNQLMQQDFSFRLAWYDQYYLGRNFRMNQYISGRSGRFGSRGLNNFSGPQVGIGLGLGFSNAYLGYNNMAFVNLNPWGFYDPFWRPRRRFAFGFGFGNSFYDPFYCPPFYNAYNGFGWRNGWRNNVFVNNNIFLDRRADRIYASNNSRSRNITRGPRVGTSRVSTVRNEAVNGSAPATRSSRYADNLTNGSRSSRNAVAGNSRGRASLNNGSTRSTSRSGIANGSSNSRSSRVRTDAYRFNNGSSRSSRSSAVRNNGSTSRSSSIGRSSSSRSSAARSSSSRSSSPSFNRSSSSSRSGYSRGSSRSSSSSRSSYSRSSSSRSSSGSRSSYSRGSSSRSSSGSASRGSSRSSSSRSSGASRSSSSSSSRSSGSSSRSSSSSSSRGSRGN